MNFFNLKIKLTIGKEYMFFSLFFLFTIIKSQTFQRFSDQKEFDDLTIFQVEKKNILNKNNFKNFSFKSGDKVLYNGKLVDFSIQNDTLIFFDKVKEIEAIALENIAFDKKDERSFSISKLKNNFFCLQTNYETGVLIRIDSDNKKTYIKSVTLFPKIISSLKDEASLEISLLPIINDLPNSNNPILTFTKKYSEIKKNKWTIQLPRIIKYPKEGLVLSFNLKYNKDKVNALYFQSSSDTSTFHYNSKYYGGWKLTYPIGFMYKLKILQ